MFSIYCFLCILDYVFNENKLIKKNVLIIKSVWEKLFYYRSFRGGIFCYVSVSLLKCFFLQRKIVLLLFMIWDKSQSYNTCFCVVFFDNIFNCFGWIGSYLRMFCVTKIRGALSSLHLINLKI